MSSTRMDGRYRDVRRLGVGGMATVTLAEDTKLGRLVALKRVHTTGDARGLTRLRREALVGASLNHPNLVSVYDVVVEDDGDLTIVMQYVAGNTLRDVVRGEGIRPLREALRILAGVASGLDAIHARGIVHRDVKPANVLLGSDGTIKLADLGVAAVAERTQITTAGAVVGTFGYMAPEQLEGRVSEPPVDIYALSAVAFEVLSGRKARPELNPLALAHAISTQPPPDLRNRWREAPADAAAVLQRGMAFAPARRPGSAGDLVRRLGAALDPASTAAMEAVTAAGAVAPPPVAPPPRAARRPEPRAAPKPARPAVAARAKAPAPAPTEAVHDGRLHRLGLLALLAAAAVVAGAVVLTLDRSGASKRTPATTASGGGAAAAARTPPASTRHHATGTSATSATQPATTATQSPPSAQTSSTPATAGAAGATTPTAAVQSFYESAAHHDFAGAWSLADANLRNQLAGYPSFQSQMSAVRSITFHQARTLPGASGSSATVAVRTTSELTSGTRQCSGTVRTLRGSGAAWMLDGLSINCTS